MAAIREVRSLVAWDSDESNRLRSCRVREGRDRPAAEARQAGRERNQRALHPSSVPVLALPSACPCNASFLFRPLPF